MPDEFTAEAQTILLLPGPGVELEDEPPLLPSQRVRGWAERPGCRRNVERRADSRLLNDLTFLLPTISGRRIVIFGRLLFADSAFDVRCSMFGTLVLARILASGFRPFTFPVSAFDPVSNKRV
jgi:hypothetical protein